MADLTTEQFDAARSRGDTLLQGPRAESVHYDAGRDRVTVRLTTGVEIGFAPMTPRVSSAPRARTC